MRTILHSVDVNASPDRVYGALATEDGLGGWWTTDVSADVREGGKIEFRFADQFAADMEVRSLEANRKVEWKCTGRAPLWQDNTFRFELQPRDEGTLLMFTQEYANEIPDEEYGRYNFNWGYYLLSLKRLCETGAGHPFNAR